MQKRLAILAVIATLAAVGLLAGQTGPLGTPQQGIAESGSGQNAEKQSNSQSGNQSSPNPVTSFPQPTAPTCDGACQQGRQNLAIQRKLEWFTGLLALVGFLQVGGMVWQALLLKQTRGDVHAQANWMKTQADQMERQLRLQEVPFKQWVEIGLWKNLTPHPRPTATEPTVTLSFEVGNSTQFPFTLKRVATRKGVETWDSPNMEHLIPPNDYYLAYIFFHISAAELELYRLDKLAAMIEIETEIRDVLRNDCDPQHFRQTVIFGPNRCEAAKHSPHIEGFTLEQTR
jgi:hypothetical protein